MYMCIRLNMYFAMLLSGSNLRTGYFESVMFTGIALIL